MKKTAQETAFHKSETTAETTYTVNADFVQEIQNSTKLMLESSATLNNIIRTIERTFAYADDAVIKSALFAFKNVAGDLSENWENVSMQLCINDLHD